MSSTPPYLLDPSHRAMLENWARGATLFVFDFDGTLAPVDVDPAHAEIPADIARQLDALARRAPVAVISGRARADLTGRLPASVQWAIGNHGSDGLPRGSGLEDQSQLCAAWEQHLHADTGLWHDAQGARVENKGRSLTLHYKDAHNAVLARSRLLARAVRLAPAPRIVRNADTVDLLPPQAMSKADVIELLMRESGCEYAMIVGDDVSDEVLFQHAPESWLTVHVGACVHTDARYQLRNLDEVCALLFHLESMRQNQDARASRQQHAAP